MKPTIPGLQNSWQPSVYPLPQQAPAAPPGLDPSSVYSFGQPWHTPNTMLNGEGGTIMAEAPKSPAAPGYLGPASAMAYQMAGPRVGFRTISLPGASQAPTAGVPASIATGAPDVPAPRPGYGALPTGENQEQNINAYLERNQIPVQRSGGYSGTVGTGGIFGSPLTGGMGAINGINGPMVGGSGMWYSPGSSLGVPSHSFSNNWATEFGNNPFFMDSSGATTGSPWNLGKIFSKAKN